MTTKRLGRPTTGHLSFDSASGGEPTKKNCDWFKYFTDLIKAMSGKVR